MNDGDCCAYWNMLEDNVCRSKIAVKAAKTAAANASEKDYSDRDMCSMYDLDMDMDMVDVDEAYGRLREAEAHLCEAEQAVVLHRTFSSRANRAKLTSMTRQKLGLDRQNPYAFAMGKKNGFPLSFTPDGKRIPSPLVAKPLNASDLRPRIRLLLKLPSPLSGNIADKRARPDSR